MGSVGVRAMAEVSAYLPGLLTKRGLITWPSAFFPVPLSSSLSSVPIDMGLWHKTCTWAQIVLVTRRPHPSSEQGCCWCSTRNSLSLVTVPARPVMPSLASLAVCIADCPVGYTGCASIQVVGLGLWV